MKKKNLIILLITILFTSNIHAQTYITRNGKITFTSNAPIEKIQAVNNEVTSIFDSKKGELGFVVLIKGFKFKKALMEEHFNENYMESNAFPKANFKGEIADIKKVIFDKEGSYPVTIKGNLTIHGVTKFIEVPGFIKVAGGNISAGSNFNIKIKDFKIKIPNTVVNNIAEIVELSVECKYVVYKKG